MCFYIYRKHKKVKIAEQDIICYKRMRNKKGNNQHIRRVISPFQGMVYIFNKLYQTKITKPFYRSEIIKEGFHSYSELKTAEELNIYNGKDIFECIIPKGSKYYYNPERNEYVSNQIIIKEKFKFQNF